MCTTARVEMVRDNLKRIPEIMCVLEMFKTMKLWFDLAECHAVCISHARSLFLCSFMPIKINNNCFHLSCKTITIFNYYSDSFSPILFIFFFSFSLTIMRIVWDILSSHRSIICVCDFPACSVSSYRF